MPSLRRVMLSLCAAVLAVPALAGPKLSFEDLVANLKSPRMSTRKEAAEELGKSRRREAVGPLGALVRDPEVKVRLEMVRALGLLRDLSAVPTLVTSLQDGDTQVRQEAVGALVELYAERDRSGPAGRFLDAFSDEFDRSSVPPHVGVDPDVYRGLAAALKDEQVAVRREAALALGILDGRDQVRDLAGALQDPDAAVRGAAATAIGKVGTAQDGKALIPLLADTDGEVRIRVLQAIGTLRVREAGPALREMYEANRRRDLGVKALACMSRVADPAQADLFKELLQDSDPERKRLAVEGLGRISDAGLLPAFKKDYQRERNEEVRLAYAFALTLLGDRAFVDSIVLALPSRTLGRRCEKYLLEMGRDLLGELYPYLNDPDDAIRGALCDIMATLGDAEAIPRLEPLLADPSKSVVDRANRAIERLKRPRARS